MRCKWCGKKFEALTPRDYCKLEHEELSQRVKQNKPAPTVVRHHQANKRKTEVDYFDRESWRKMAEEKNARLLNHPYAVKLPKGLIHDQDDQLPT